MCGSPTAPDVFTQIRSYRNWIDAHLGEATPIAGYSTRMDGRTLDFGVTSLDLTPFIKQFDVTPLIGLDPLSALFSWTIEDYGIRRECSFTLDFGDGTPKQQFEECNEQNAAFHVYEAPNIYRAVLELRLENESITIPKDIYAIPASDTLDLTQPYFGDITNQDFYSEALDSYFDVHTISNQVTGRSLELRVTSNNLTPNVLAFDTLSFQPLIISTSDNSVLETELPSDSDAFLLLISPNKQLGSYTIEFGEDQPTELTKVLEQGERFEGTLERGDSLDAYGKFVDHFELTSSSRRLLIKATGVNTSPAINIWADDTQNVLFQIPKTSKNTGYLAFDPVDGLTYGITISDNTDFSSGMTPYSLEVLEAPPGSESSLTNNITDGELSTTDFVTDKGAFSDKYLFQKSYIAESVSVRLVSAEFDPLLEVLDADGTVIATNDNSLDGRNAVIGLSDVQAGSSIRVTSTNPGETGSYQVTLTLVE